MEQGSTPESAGSARPFKYYGKQGEFTMLAPLKPGPGVAERARALVGRAQETDTALVGTLHNIRVGLVDNDTRLLFATVYDGDWDQYIDDFVANPEVSAILEDLFGNLEGFPGMHSPEVREYLVKHSVLIDYFWTAYPETTVDRIKRGERVLAGVEQVLDAAG
jgi:hypothetical protein